MTIIMFALIAVLIIFMIRNGKKRQQAAQEMQSNLRPGAEVMLQSGIYGTVEEVDEEANRVTVRSGSSTLVVHRNAVGQIVTPVEPAHEPADEIAPDDDPEFGERIGEKSEAAPAQSDAAQSDGSEGDGATGDRGADESSTDESSTGDGSPKA